MDRQNFTQNFQNNPIGIFDSGIGGLSVLKEIKKALPSESIIYFADSKNCPYGSKSWEEAFALARRKIEFLLEHQCKLIVIACNTVTAIAIERFRSDYRVPFVGMEPALKPAALNTRTRKIGILATENTFNGKHFKQTFEKYGSGIDVFVQAGVGLVELVEQGRQKTEKAFRLLESYIAPMMEKGADTLVLGCTHYPFLLPAIQKITKDKLTIIDPSHAVATQVERVLDRFNLQASPGFSPGYRFYTTGNKSIVETTINACLNQPYHLEQVDM